MNRKDRTIHTGWLIDGSGRPARRDALIKLSGGLISSVTGYTAGSSEYLDFTDCTIIPALCDSHTHLAISGELDPEIRDNQLQYGYDQAEPMITDHARDYLRHGVLTVRDGGDFNAHALRYKNEHQNKKDLYLSIYAAGNGIHVKGRYGQL
ncbi:MAG: hypothetical protein GX846_05110 [Deltaproteobacteria bacterium]|nr:hypothetical protein [Deltaproteobacteria bacterium]